MKVRLFVVCSDLLHSFRRVPLTEIVSGGDGGVGGEDSDADSITARQLLRQPSHAPAGPGRSHISARQLADMRRTFQSMDTNGDGSISIEELRSALKEHGLELTDNELEELFNDVDLDSNEEINFDEFLSLMSRYLQHDDNLEDAIREAFEMFDEDGNGMIDMKELSQVMRSLDPQITDEEIREMMLEADIGGDGTIDYNEFMAMMTAKSATLNFSV